MATRILAGWQHTFIALPPLAPSARAQGPFFQPPVVLDAAGDSGKNNGKAVGPIIASDGTRFVAVWNNFVGGAGDLVEIMSSSSTDGVTWSAPTRISPQGT